jgi:hypothetical protein
VFVVLLVFLVVSCGFTWLRLVTLVFLWSLASLALGLLPLPRVRLALVRSGLTVLLLVLPLSLLLLLLLPLAWLLRGVCLCLPNCFSSLLLRGWACFFFSTTNQGDCQ